MQVKNENEVSEIKQRHIDEMNESKRQAEEKE